MENITKYLINGNTLLSPSYIGFQLIYLGLTLAYSKCYGQGHAYFD